MLTSKEIRQQFIDFFIQKQHIFVHSSPVIPADDPTLLFANAGMNQFKSIFLGQREISYKRAVNSQKCIRAGGKHNDLEEVGKDGYHHTFFEMLGNWSFGDYYKQEAISWAWELLTEVWQLPKDKLYATVHDTDSEAYELWKSHTDIHPANISFHGDKDNFWEMGETGPCGPCSEIHIDRGAAHCDKQHIPGHECKVNGDCARYIELWNLVFIQYNREADRSLTPLQHKFVDTGAGLERITQVLQEKNSNYETDLFMPIIDKLVELSGVAYNPESGISHRVIADHVRCLCFALADGGFPSNEGRGYVLRRILRRAARHGRLLGFAEPFLHALVTTVTGLMGHHYTELTGKEEFIKMVIKAEEERFNKTLDTGLEKFNEICSRQSGRIIAGADAFMLYDTYGFPLDLSLILAEEHGKEIDITGFTAEMEAQRTRARSASKFGSQAANENWLEFCKPAPTEFVGYTQTEVVTIIQRFSIDDDRVLIQLAKSPFYAESGGQVADSGIISNTDFTLQITDVKKVDESLIHYGKLVKGAISDKPVKAEIDASRRKSIARNHTASHLLHKALREVLGTHVQQKGSLVHPDYLRFDFAHFQAVTLSELQKVEGLVNQAILANLVVFTSIESIETAKKSGAMALFGEKYSDEVRVVTVDGFSKELCGGTHVNGTGEIGLFKINSESSIAAGIRRIEAITGEASLAWITNLQESYSSFAHKLHSPLASAESKLDAVLERLSQLEAQLRAFQAKAGDSFVSELLAKAENKGRYQLICAQTAIGSVDELKNLADNLKTKLQGTIAVIFNLVGDKLNILCVVSPELTSGYPAGKIVGLLAAKLDGKGGGRPDSAMAGGKAIDKLPQVMAKVSELIDSI